MKISPSTKIYVSDSKIKNAGRGVFASEDIARGEVIEICPMIDVAEDDAINLKESILSTYYYSFDDTPGFVAIVLGYGSVYNHSYEPNATYKKNPTERTLVFTAIKDIKKDEEITVSYNHGDPNNKSPLWEDIPVYKKAK